MTSPYLAFLGFFFGLAFWTRGAGFVFNIVRNTSTSEGVVRLFMGYVRG